MPKYCPNCGSEAPETARFCAGCGFVLPVTVPPPGAGPEAQPALHAPSPEPRVAFAAPGPHRLSPPPPGHGVPAVIVAVAGAVAVAAGVAALVVFLTAGHTASARAPIASPSQPPPPPPSPAVTAGTHGSLASAFPNAVDGFTLDQASLQQDPILISAGATDSLEGTYSDSSGTQVLADLGGFGRARTARQEVLNVAHSFVHHGFSVASPQPLTDNRGTQIGVFVTADGSTVGQPDHVLESSNNLYEEFVGSDFSTLAEFSRTFP